MRTGASVTFRVYGASYARCGRSLIGRMGSRKSLCRARRSWQTDRTMGFLIRVVINAFSIWVVTLIPALGVTVVAFPPGGTLQYVLTLLLVAAIFAVVNTFIGTVI